MVSSCVHSGNANHYVSIIYTEKGSFIRKVISCHLTDEHEADDVFQSFFLHLVANPLTNDADNIEAYIYRSIVNFIKNRVRQTACYRTNLNEYAKTVGVVETEESPEKVITDAEETAKFFELIRKRLPDNEYLAIALHYRDEYSFSKVAEIMKVEVDSVRHHIARGIARLRGSLTRDEVSAFRV